MFFTGLLILFFFAVLILGHELGHFIAAKKAGFEVEEFGFGLPPKIIGKKIKGTVYSLNAIPFGGFVKVKGLIPEDDDAEKHQKLPPAWKRFFVFIAGILMNFFIAWIAFTFIFLIGVKQTVYIQSVLPDSPASIAGIKDWDEVKGFATSEEMINFVSQNPGSEIRLDLVREGQDVSVTVIPQVDESGKSRIGVALQEGGIEKQPFFLAIGKGFMRTIDTTVYIFQALVHMFTAADFSGTSGPVGVFKAVSLAGSMGMVYFLQLLAVVSINLFVINFLPFPALDGGHILFLIIEKIRRRPLSQKVLGIVIKSGFFILLALMFLATAKDIVNLFK